MKVVFTQEVRKNICEEVFEMQKTNSSKVADIVKQVANKHNVQHRRIYEWNKAFGYIFKNDLLSTDYKINLLQEVKNIAESENISIKQAMLKISEKYNISYKELYSWNRKLNILNTKQKYSNEDKIYILNEIKKQSNPENMGEVILQFAHKLDISEHTIYTWNRQFQIIDVRVYNNRNTSIYDEEFKKMILRYFIAIGFNNKNVKMIAVKCNITERNIYDWNRTYQMFDTKVFKVGKYNKTKKEIIEKLETDQEFKKNLINSINQKSL